jgi:putative inorganic carbon (HCO3(-)) transporter
LALLMALGVFVVHHLGWRKGAVLALLVVVAIACFGPDRFSAKSVEGDDSAMGRILAWQDGLSMFVKNPFMGVGYKQFQVHHGIPAHNSFVHAFGEGGLYTALTWVGVNYWAILTLVRIRRRRKTLALPEGAAPEEKPEDRKWTDYTVALQAGLMASLTAGMFLSHTYRPFPVIPVALTAALAGFLLKGQPKKADWPHYLGVPAVVGVGIVVIYFIVQHALVIG